ncbi:unnamed protein product [Didymodactylos carnosus]|uniref:CKK domain-containing protein n=1 Tax=Didymodactylos carnosus TaxID=1234261 RepID=A0A813PHI4_9BILA|nr:unnamed protein product [Didymodactylos carnosus]CAF0820112.1 unnamed protein product [Didymodactylos carnosus]CAF3530881.1 unnamed protein product [Didymodactylos carnosus]CAF3604352.1 unnamed protein product [Didymodactylos carnosus]
MTDFKSAAAVLNYGNASKLNVSRWIQNGYKSDFTLYSSDEPSLKQNSNNNIFKHEQENNFFSNSSLPAQSFFITSPTASCSTACSLRSAFDNNNIKSTTTWVAQAKLTRTDSNRNSTSLSLQTNNKNSGGLNGSIDNDLQEKLNCIRAQLDAKKQRRLSSATSTVSSTNNDETLISNHSSERDSYQNDDNLLSKNSNSNNLLSVVHNEIEFQKNDNQTIQRSKHTGNPLVSRSFQSLPNSRTFTFSINSSDLNEQNSPPTVTNSYTHHHHHFHSPSHLTLPSMPCLVEESPSETNTSSGFSDGSKSNNDSEKQEQTIRENISNNTNPAIIDLTKPLSKEEMLATMQILKELWKKNFGSEIPDIQHYNPPPTTPLNSSNNRLRSRLLHNRYHSTPALNKLSAELGDIKEKLTRFSGKTSNDTNQSQGVNSTKSNESEIDSKENNSQIGSDELLDEIFPISNEESLFLNEITFGNNVTTSDIDEMQRKKDALIRRQIQRREEQLQKKVERQSIFAKRQEEYRLFEEFMSQRRNDDNLRRNAILQAHVEQKRMEADPDTNRNYNITRLRRKASSVYNSSLCGLGDENSFGSNFDLFKGRMQTPRRTTTRFDSPTASFQSKMNRTVSMSNVRNLYESNTSIATTGTPTKLPFGGSLMNLTSQDYSPFGTKQIPRRKIVPNNYDLSSLSASCTSLATTVGSRLTRNPALLTKSNKQSTLNALKQVVLAGPANDRQREIVYREVELSDHRHYVILFRDHRLQYRALYAYIPDTDVIEKIHGQGPQIITEIMVEKFYKYNSGSKQFSNIPIKHFSIQCDAVVIHNDFWQRKLLNIKY